MSERKQIKQGDTAPSVTATLLDAAGDPANINGATVRFLLVDAFTGLEFLFADATNDQTDETTNVGEVHYDWVEGDTDVPGIYRGEFEVTYSENQIESFPNSSYLEVEIIPKSVEAGAS